MPGNIYLAGLGMITAVGGNAVMNAASVNARISGLCETDYYNTELEPMTMGLVPTGALPPLNDLLQVQSTYTPWEQRLLRLGHAAISEAMQGYADKEPLPLFLACPEFYPQCPHSLPDDFIQSLIKQSGAHINTHLSRTLHTGRTGVLDAIDLAKRFFVDSDTESVLVGGIDSFQRQDLLEILDKENRVLAADVVDGFAPGEGAGFLRITKNEAKALTNGQHRIALAESVTGQEQKHFYSDEPCLFDGLTHVMSETLTEYSGLKINRIYSSQNGEVFWAKELSVAMLRNKSHFHESCLIEHPADCYGDLGAATGAVLIGLAAQQLLKQNQSIAHLVCCSSDHSFRATMLVDSA